MNNEPENQSGLQNIEEMLTAVQESPLQVGYREDSLQGLLDVSLPHNCFISAVFSKTAQEVTIGLINVNPLLRRHGIGTRLMRGLAKKSIELGAQKLSGRVTSLEALKTRAKVFKPENLDIYRPSSLMHIIGNRKMSYIEAVEEIESKGKTEYIVGVNLTKIDPQSLEDTAV